MSKETSKEELNIVDLVSAWCTSISLTAQNALGRYDTKALFNAIRREIEPRDNAIQLLRDRLLKAGACPDHEGIEEGCEHCDKLAAEDPDESWINDNLPGVR